MSNASRQGIVLLLGLLLLLQAMLGATAIAFKQTGAMAQASAAVEAPPCHGNTGSQQAEPEHCPCCDQLDCSDMASCLGVSVALNQAPPALACDRGQTQVAGMSAAPRGACLNPLLRPPIPPAA